MKFDINDFRTDDNAKQEGVWVDFGGSAEFKIASLDNPEFQKAFRRKTKPYADMGREIPEKDQEAIMNECLAKHVVLGWKGVFDGDKELKFTTEAALRLMSEISWVRDRVIQEARRLDNFKAKQAEETEGN